MGGPRKFKEKKGGKRPQPLEILAEDTYNYGG